MLPPLDIARAKTAPLLTVLAELGHKWTKQVGQEYYYHSPLRDEKTPSFCVRPADNLWYDHGAGAGGNVLDLVLQLTGTTFADGVRFLLDYAGADGADAVAAPMATTGTANTVINLKRQPLTDASLLKYLSQDRGLDMALLGKSRQLPALLGQALYERVGKPTIYRSVAWANDSGGLVLKYAGFTSVHGAAGYTLVPAIKPSGPRILMVFEGFINYLSALTLARYPEFGADVLVLNSVTNTAAALGLVTGYDRVELCLDNDRTGNVTTDAWLAACAAHSIEAEDLRPQWAGYNDVNDLLCGRLPAPKQAKPTRAASQAVAGTAPARAPGYGRWWVWIKWKTPRVYHKTGEMMETQVYYSDDDQYTSRDRIKAQLKRRLLADEVAVARLCTKDENGKMKILEQWPKPQ